MSMLFSSRAEGTCDIWKKGKGNVEKRVVWPDREGEEH